MIPGRPPAPPGKAPKTLTERLGLTFDWYKGMISETTGRLVYTFHPETDVATADGSPIRDVAALWDVELLSRFLNRAELRPVVERALSHYAGYLVARDGTLVLDPEKLGEPSGIAHSAFMILALVESDLSERQPKVLALAEGILRQQRQDGSYRIYFGDQDDDGLEFYPGEAMLALMHAYDLAHDARLLTSVERGFGYFRERLPTNPIRADLRVFFANWQSQYAVLLHANTNSDALAKAVRDYVLVLHDQIVEAGFYQDIERDPMRQATVEVACALEGLNDAYTISAREKDGNRARTYEKCIRIASSWLCRAQRLDCCTPRERGGFGYSLHDRTQRIDLTGHVVAGFIKTARNRIGV